jgi:flagellar basal body rod protein FlgG
MKKIIYCLFVSIPFISCEVKVNMPSGDGSGGKIRNGIQFTEKGLKVEQAFLVFEDGKRVPSDNKVDVGQWIGLRLIVDGWKKKDGKVFVDAEEQITTSDGKQLLDEKNLFKDYADGLNSEDARALTVSARITAIDKLYDYFTVSFRVWDTQNQNETSGSYKLYLK